MSSMEPEVQEFLKKVLRSVFIGLFWLLANMTLGIYFGLLFAPDGLHLANLLFYIFFVLTLGWVIRYYYRTWKPRIP
jgi:hypothetical protein